MTGWTAADMPDQAGRTALVTGASDGLGLCTAEALAARGAAVLLGCRNPGKAERAQERVAAAATGPAPAVVRLDLADLASVRSAAERIVVSVGRLDILVNNAGVMAVPLARTADGFELQFGTNHLGHYALTGLVLPALLGARSPRVVTVSSDAHRMARNRWDDPGWERHRYSRWGAYARSKLANLLFVRELARRAAEADSTLVSVGAHPGYASTNLVVASAAASGSRVGGPVMRAVTPILGQSAARGALPQLYAATMPDVRPAQYVGPDGLFRMRGTPTLAATSRAARDEAAARRLWELSAELTGVTYCWSAGPAGTPG